MESGVVMAVKSVAMTLESMTMAVKSVAATLEAVAMSVRTTSPDTVTMTPAPAPLARIGGRRGDQEETGHDSDRDYPLHEHPPSVPGRTRRARYLE